MTDAQRPELVSDYLRDLQAKIVAQLEAVDGAGMPVLRGALQSRPATAAQIRGAPG